MLWSFARRRRPAEEQAREDATAATGMERGNPELKMELADMKRKCQVLEEQVHEVTADVRMLCGKKIKFGWGDRSDQSPRCDGTCSTQEGKGHRTRSQPQNGTETGR